MGFVYAELQGSALFLFLNCSSVHVVADASGYLIGGSPMLKIELTLKYLLFWCFKNWLRGKKGEGEM